MEQPKEKRYRKIIVNLPEHLAFKVEKRIGGNSINALVKLFLLQFARGKAGLNIEFELSAEESATLKKDI